MKVRKATAPCLVCNTGDAKPGEYCENHLEELHRLDHQYESLFRLQRYCRGKDHEIFNIFMPGDCEPAGRAIVTETDPENLLVTVLITSGLNLETRIADYERLKIERTYGDQLRERFRMEIVQSWYGNARACVDLFRTADGQPEHWDIEPRSEASDDPNIEPHPFGGGKHSIH